MKKGNPFHSGRFIGGTVKRCPICGMQFSRTGDGSKADEKGICPRCYEKGLARNKKTA